MAWLEQWFIPLLIVAGIFYVIWLSRPGFNRGASPPQVGPGDGRGGPREAAGRRRGSRPRDAEWVHIQTAIGSDRALLPTAGLLRRNGVEVRIVRTSLMPGRRLVRLAVRQVDLKRAREILSREDLYLRSGLHS